jgi:hypothetical protein
MAVPFSRVTLLIHPQCNPESPPAKPSPSLLHKTVLTNQVGRHNPLALNQQPRTKLRHTLVLSASCNLNLRKKACITNAPPWCRAVWSNLMRKTLIQEYQWILWQAMELWRTRATLHCARCDSDKGNCYHHTRIQLQTCPINWCMFPTLSSLIWADTPNLTNIRCCTIFFIRLNHCTV